MFVTEILYVTLDSTATSFSSSLSAFVLMCVLGDPGGWPQDLCIELLSQTLLWICFETGSPHVPKLPSVGSYLRSSCLISQNARITGIHASFFPQVYWKDIIASQRIENQSNCYLGFPLVDKVASPTGGPHSEGEGSIGSRAFHTESWKSLLQMAEGAWSCVPAIPRGLKMHIVHTLWLWFCFQMR